MADRRMLIDDEPRPRASRDTLQALTVALVKPVRDDCWSQVMNSSSAKLYTRRVIGEETLSRTSAFNRCQSADFSIVLKEFI
jgi:hypothetical protein